MNYLKMNYEHCTFIVTDVCANLKTLHTCADGTPYEKFMKDHCKKTCEKCGELKLPTFSTQFLEEPNEFEEFNFQKNILHVFNLN